MNDLSKTIQEINSTLNSIFDEMQNDLVEDESVGLTEFHFRFNEIEFARNDFDNAIHLLQFLLNFDEDNFDETQST